MGFAADGRVTAVDLYIVQENGPNTGFNDWTSAAEAVSLVYQPPAMRFRGVPVLTNTPPRGPQRGPGQNQIAAAVEPLIDKAAQAARPRPRRDPAHQRARQRGEDRLDAGRRDERLSKGCARSRRASSSIGASGKRAAASANGSKVRGVGVGTAYHSAGGNGFDGLVRITPDGKIHIHTGVGNLGTYSHTVTSRVAAEVLKANWDNCIVVRGDSRKHLPWNLGQFGSNTSFTMTRTNYVAAMDAVAKLKEIAAMDLGGAPDDYDIGGERVFAKSDPGKGLTYAQAAQRAIELGGKFDGHEVRERLERHDEGLGGRRGRHGPRRRREGQPAAHGHGAGACGRLHRDRARRRDGQVRDPRLRRRGRLRHRAAPAGPERIRSRAAPSWALPTGTTAPSCAATAGSFAVESRPVRQQYLVHDDAHELCRRGGRRRRVKGDRGDGFGRRAGRLRYRRRAGIPEERFD